MPASTTAACGRTARRPTILVVEDEPILRMMAVDMVEGAGFDVVEARDAGEAIRILETRLDITVMFTDIDMPPGIDGLRLAAIVRNRWPPIHIIVTSGHLQPDPWMLPPRAEFFAKPYAPDSVIAAMRRLTA